MEVTSIGAALAIGLSAFGVAIGQGFLVYQAVKTIGKNPKMSGYYMTITILGIALVESCALYGLVLAIQMIGNSSLDFFSYIGVGVAIGFTGLGAGIGEGILISGALESMNINTENKSKILTYMILLVALIETCAIYGLVISFQILGTADLDGLLALGAALAVGLSGFGVSIGEGMLAKKALGVMGQNEKMLGVLLPITILGIALIETCSIYGLVIGFRILSLDASVGLASIGAGLAVGLSGLGVGIGEGFLGCGALDAIGQARAKRTKIITYLILFLALVETCAIYGLILGFQILGKEGLDGVLGIGAGLAVGLSGIGVAIGEGLTAKKSLEAIGKRSRENKFLVPMTILGIALIETCAIYGLIISFQILGGDNINGLSGLGAGLAIGLSGLGVGFGEGILVVGALDAFERGNLSKNKLLTYMILFLALIETCSIYGLVIGFQILSNIDLDGWMGLGAGLAVGLSGIGVAIGEGMLAKKAIEIMGGKIKNDLFGAFHETRDANALNKFILPVGILGIALIETCAIYGLIISFQILGASGLDGFSYLGAAFAIGISGIGVGIGEGMLAVGALDSISQGKVNKSKILTYMILFLALIETCSIYGLIIGFQILSNSELNGLLAIGAGLAVGLAGFGVAIGEGRVAKKVIEILGEKKEITNFILPVGILGIALIESCAIYGLIISFQILDGTDFSGLAAIGAGLAVGLSGFGVGIGEGLLAESAFGAMASGKVNKTSVLTYMILFIALVESCAIYGLIMGFSILSGETMGFLGLAAGLAVGLSSLGVGLGEGYLATGTMEIMGLGKTNKARNVTYSILFLALVETCSIYGLVIGFQILGYEFDNMALIGAALAIGLAGLGVALGESFLAKNSINALGKRPEYTGIFLTMTILGIALVETCAIYAIVVGFNILSAGDISGLLGIGAGIAVGLSGLGVGMGEGYLVGGIGDAIYRNPIQGTKNITLMILFLALIETCAIYGLVVGFKLLG